MRGLPASGHPRPTAHCSKILRDIRAELAVRRPRLGPARARHRRAIRLRWAFLAGAPRTKAGGLQGFRNVCRHRGARLVEGDAHTGLAFCIDGRLRCPYHGWTYDEAGALVSIPAGQHFDELDADAHSLHQLHVGQWRGLVFAAFQAPRQAVEQVLDAAAGTWPDLTSMRT